MKKEIIIGLVILMAFGLATKMASAIDPLVSEWYVTWGGVYSDQAWDVIEHNSFLYVTGRDEVSLTNINLFIRKYDLDGNMIWEEIWDNGPWDSGFVIRADGSYLYIGGFTRILLDQGYVNKALLQKRSLDGTLVWTKTWGDITNGHHEVDGIAIVGDYIYVSHWDGTWGFQNINAVLKKFDRGGNLIWSTTWGTLETKQDTTDGHIYADETGVWVCGRIDGDSLVGGGDAYLTKIAPDSTQLWLEKWGGGGFDDALSLSSDGSHVYVSGMTTRYGLDAFLLKYDMDGNLIWDITQGASFRERSRGISAVDGQYVYMSMWTTSYGEGGDTILLKYRKGDGALVGGGGKEADDVTNSIYVDASYVYMVGRTSSFGNGYNDDAILMKVQKY